MRSEREAGPGLMRGGGREKWPMDTPLRRESPRRDPEAPPNPPPPPPSPPSPLPPLHPTPVKQRDEKKTALSKVRGRERGTGRGGRTEWVRGTRGRGRGVCVWERPLWWEMSKDRASLEGEARPRWALFSRLGLMSGGRGI